MNSAEILPEPWALTRVDLEKWVYLLPQKKAGKAWMGHWHRSAISREEGGGLVTMAWKNCNAGSSSQGHSTWQPTDKNPHFVHWRCRASSPKSRCPTSTLPFALAQLSSRGMGPCSLWWSTRLGRRTRADDVLGLKRLAADGAALPTVDGVPLPAAKVFPAVPTHDITKPKKWRRTI